MPDFCKLGPLKGGGSCQRPTHLSNNLQPFFSRTPCSQPGKQMTLKTQPEHKELEDSLRRSAKTSLSPEEEREGSISFTMGMLGPDDEMTREEVAKHFDDRYGKVAS